MQIFISVFSDFEHVLSSYILYSLNNLWSFRMENTHFLSNWEIRNSCWPVLCLPLRSPPYPQRLWPTSLTLLQRQLNIRLNLWRVLCGLHLSTSPHPCTPTLHITSIVIHTGMIPLNPPLRLLRLHSVLHLYHLLVPYLNTRTTSSTQIFWTNLLHKIQTLNLCWVVNKHLCLASMNRTGWHTLALQDFRVKLKVLLSCLRLISMAPTTTIPASLFLKLLTLLLQLLWQNLLR